MSWTNSGAVVVQWQRHDSPQDNGPEYSSVLPLSFMLLPPPFFSAILSLPSSASLLPFFAVHPPPLAFSLPPSVSFSLLPSPLFLLFALPIVVPLPPEALPLPPVFIYKLLFIPFIIGVRHQNRVDGALQQHCSSRSREKISQSWFLNL